MRHGFCSAVVCAVGVLLAAGLVVWTGGDAAAQEEGKGVSVEKIKEMRAEAAHSKRRIIFDNDGNEPVYYCEEATREALLDKRTTALAGTQVDSIFYCTWSSGFGYFTHNTKVGSIFNCVAEEPDKGPGSGFSKNKTQELIDNGHDPLQVMVEFGKEHDIEIFWSMRMNDVHDAWGAWYSPHLFPPIKKEHPEWVIGTKENRPKNGGYTAIDFAVPEVRDLAFRFFEEVCQNYDVDGVQCDFFRHLNYFRKVANGEPAGQEELDMMTDLIRRIRVMADEEGAKRGRPILLSVRVPDSAELCKVMGFDIERWMSEGLIDILVVSGYFRLNPWETSVELGHKYNIPVYPCLSETRVRDGEAKKVRASLESYRARAASAWNAGVDGIYMFNFFHPQGLQWRELGDAKTLAPLDKVYCAGVRGYGNLDFWYEGGEQYMNRSLLSPDWARKLTPGQPETVDLVVG
ncbi:MAG: family 10 glycosylhydrolase, partial [bacterium]|nr:family 10 glycosylhydrolase [bacterium]